MARWELLIVISLIALWLFVGLGTIAIVMSAVGRTDAAQLLLQVFQ